MVLTESPVQAVKVTESLEYKTLEAELSSTTESLEQVRETLQNLHMEMCLKQQQNDLLNAQVCELKFWRLIGCILARW